MIEWINQNSEDKDHIFFRKITQDDIVLEPSLRDLCKMNQCGQYGTNWMCPHFLKDVKASIGPMGGEAENYEF